MQLNSISARLMSVLNGNMLSHMLNIYHGICTLCHLFIQSQMVTRLDSLSLCLFLFLISEERLAFMFKRQIFGWSSNMRKTKFIGYLWNAMCQTRKGMSFKDLHNFNNLDYLFARLLKREV